MAETDFDRRQAELTDREYFLALYEELGPVMFHTVRQYVSSAHVVEDLVQDTLMKLLPKVFTLRQLSRKARCAYVVYAVKNTCKNYLRHQAVVDAHTIMIDFSEENNAAAEERAERSPEELLLMAESRETLARVLERLPEETRQLLMGKYLLELPDAALAELLGCTAGSIRMRLSRARRQIIKIMEEGEHQI